MLQGLCGGCCRGYVLVSDDYNTTLRPILQSLWDRIGLSPGPSVEIMPSMKATSLAPWHIHCPWTNLGHHPQGDADSQVNEFDQSCKVVCCI